MTAQLANYIDQIGMIAGIFRPFSMDEISKSARCMEKGLSALEASQEIFGLI